MAWFCAAVPPWAPVAAPTAVAVAPAAAPKTALTAKAASWPAGCLPLTTDWRVLDRLAPLTPLQIRIVPPAAGPTASPETPETAIRAASRAVPQEQGRRRRWW